MLENAALALALANEAGALNRLDDAAAGAALEATVLPGRAEVLREAPLVIADGAHTRASVEALVEILDARAPTRLVAVVSVTRGKDAAHVLSPLTRRAHTIIATTAEASRSLPAAELACDLQASGSCAAIASIDAISDAIRTAVRVAGRAGTVCVTGSIYMAGGRPPHSSDRVTGAVRRSYPESGWKIHIMLEETGLPYRTHRASITGLSRTQVPLPAFPAVLAPERLVPEYVERHSEDSASDRLPGLIFVQADRFRLLCRREE